MRALFFFSCSVLTTAQVRPMVFPHLQSSSTPDSAVSNVASEPQPLPPEEEKPMDPPPPPPEEGKISIAKKCYCLISKNFLMSINSCILESLIKEKISYIFQLPVTCHTLSEKENFWQRF